MSTTAQFAANQQNAQASTGPKTPEGKAASSQNATKHGLSGAFRVLPGESQDAFDRLVRSYVDELHPNTEGERFLVLQMAQSRWRLERFQRLEAAVVEKMVAESETDDSPDGVIAAAMLARTNNAFAALQRYAAAAERSYYKAKRELENGRKSTAESDTKIQNEPNFPAPPAPPARQQPKFTVTPGENLALRL